jgi:hypothetical protein
MRGAGVGNIGAREYAHSGGLQLPNDLKSCGTLLRLSAALRDDGQGGRPRCLLGRSLHSDCVIRRSGVNVGDAVGAVGKRLAGVRGCDVDDCQFVT